MRNVKLWLTAALLAGIVVAGSGDAQPPELKKGPPREFGQQAPISVDEMVEWLMSFDKDKKGKITKEDLPERMQFLIEKGDLNKDGALDRDEIRKLVSSMSGGQAGFGFGVRVSGSSGPGGGGSGPLPRPAPGVGIGFGGPGPGPGGSIEGVVDDLKLPEKKKEQALAVAKAHQENVHKLMGQARADMLQKMKEILSEEEFKDFQAALDRPRGATAVFVGPGDGPRPGELERKVEQLQKEVEELRRQQGAKNDRKN
jgi:hypothetical protein